MSEEMNDYTYDKLEHVTEMAWLFNIDGKKHWLPKSQCNIDRGNNIVSVPEWLAIEKGLE